jgi:hypothetical protein
MLPPIRSPQAAGVCAARRGAIAKSSAIKPQAMARKDTFEVFSNLPNFSLPGGNQLFGLKNYTTGERSNAENLF